MKVMQGWDQTEAFDGSYEKLPADGYVCVILSAKETRSKSGKEMLALCLDIAEGPHAGFFRRRYDQKKDQAGATWPCVFNQLLYESDGSNSRYFKGLIKSVEESNPGYRWTFDEKTLSKKKVGMLFREEEFLGTDGSVRTNTKPAFPRNADVIRSGNYSVLEAKKLSGGYTSGATQRVDEYIQVDEASPWEKNSAVAQTDDGLPF